MKKLFLTVIAAAALTMSALAAPVPPEVAAPSAILVERSSGTVLFEKNSHEKLAPASVTKVMTMLLTIEAVERGQISLEDEVVTSDHAASMGGSQIYLEPGERMSLHEMLKSIAVSSANDACVAVAEHIAGSEATFVSMMNDRAAQLGMKDTHFVNCCGLDSDEHYTTAYDISLMSRELLKHDMIRQYTTIWMDTVRNGEFGLSNTNKLVRFYDGTTGVKTGFTTKAGYCISASAERDGMELIAVIMKSDTSPHRNADASGLLNYGFANYAVVGLGEGENGTEPIPVTLGHADSVAVELAENAQVLIEKAQAARVEKQLVLAESLEAPVEKGQKVGTLVFTLNGQQIAEVPVVAAESVERLGTMEIYGDILKSLLLKK